MTNLKTKDQLLKELLDIDDRNGWQEEINEENAVAYMVAAMSLIRKLKEDLEISQELVSELLVKIVEIEELYLYKGDEDG